MIGYSAALAIPSLALGLHAPPVISPALPPLTLSVSPAPSEPVQVTVPLTVRALYGGEFPGIPAMLRYDWDLRAFAGVNRVVRCPPPPPCPSPTPSASPPPSPRLRPRPHSHPTVVRTPAPAPRTAAAVPLPPPPPSPPPPPARKRHRPRRHPAPPPPSPSFVPLAAELPKITNPEPKPALPLGVLITVVLAPCVAAAATRFGRH